MSFCLTIRRRSPAASSPRAAPPAGLADYPGDFPETLDEAYADPGRGDRRLGQAGRSAGRSAGSTRRLSERFGTDRLAGPIFAAQTAGADGDGARMPVFAEGFAAGEAEFLLRIGRDAAAGPDGDSPSTKRPT